MIETARRFLSIGLPLPVCVAVHALFAEGSFAALKENSARIATTNTVVHPSNAIDISEPLAGITELLHGSWSLRSNETPCRDRLSAEPPPRRTARRDVRATRPRRFDLPQSVIASDRVA